MSISLVNVGFSSVIDVEICFRLILADSEKFGLRSLRLEN